jgi:hypothetical protein
MGVDEIYRGKNDKFLTVVSNLETGEPLWFGKARKKETLDEFFKTRLRSGQRKRIEAPLRRTRCPRAALGAVLSSAIPRITVPRDKPLACATAVTPPKPMA